MNLDETLNQAFEALSDRLRAELDTAAGRIASAVRAERRLSDQAPPPPGHIGDDVAAAERVLEGVGAIGAARSLSEVLDTLAAMAACEASRAAILLVRGGNLVPFRFVGFPQRFDVPGSVRVPMADAGVIADALSAGSAVSGANAPLFAALPPGARCVAIPIALGGEVVAVLYADRGGEAGKDAAPWTPRVEVFARFAARCLEALTAFRTAQLAQSNRTDIPGAAGPGSPEDGAEPGDADAAARRYARLLVSEIKLYHERDVIAGRQARDLGTRLGVEIARARSLYEQRVPPHVGHRADYFHAELVRTLAEGDAALLAAR